MNFAKDNRLKRHANEFRRTQFANSGRIAGTGILYDDYSEEAYPSVIIRTDYFPDYKVGYQETKEEKDFRDNGGEVVSYRLKKEGD